jgi:hypothetical protein
MKKYTSAHSFATYANAVRKIEHILGDRLPEYHWLIIAQDDGEGFSPLVFLRDHQMSEALGLARAGLCVINA